MPLTKIFATYTAGNYDGAVGDWDISVTGDSNNRVYVDEDNGLWINKASLQTPPVEHIITYEDAFDAGKIYRVNVWTYPNDTTGKLIAKCGEGRAFDLRINQTDSSIRDWTAGEYHYHSFMVTASDTDLEIYTESEDGEHWQGIIRYVAVMEVSASWACNPANIIYDVLTNTRYGLGGKVSASQIDTDSLEAFADYCDEEIEYTEVENGVELTKSQRRFEINLVLDTEHKAIDAINKICTSCRAIPVWSGNQFKIIIDEASTTYAQTFSMGNIVKDSFSETYIGGGDIPESSRC